MTQTQTFLDRDLEGKYLTFELAGEIYGLGILKVQEIIGMMNVTSVPRTSDFVRGVINLRGKVIPVIDLRLKFGLSSTQDTERTCIVVVQIQNESAQMTMGVIVDEVSEVLNIMATDIEPAPSFGESSGSEFILGMGKVGQRVVMLLDVDKVLTGQEVTLMRHMSHNE